MLTHDVMISDAQAAALVAGETRTVSAETPGGSIQRGDTVRIRTGIGGLFPDGVLEFEVRRVVGGTKTNGILPGWSVLELWQTGPLPAPAPLPTPAEAAAAKKGRKGDGGTAGGDAGS